MTGSLEQAVARALKEIPHDAICGTLLGEFSSPCDCSREQRLAARVAAAIEHGLAHAGVIVALGAPERAMEEARAAALRALTQQETPT